MNALSPILADPIASAVERANGWLRVGRPVIKAYFALDDADSELLAASHDFRGHKRWNEPQGYDEQTTVEARAELRKPINNLRAMMDGIRSDFIADEMPRWTEGCDTDAIDAEYELFEEAMADVLTVDAALKLVGDEA